MDTRNPNELLADLRAHAEAAETTARALLALLPPADATVASLLEALAAADDLAKENFIRWPRPSLDADHPDYPYREGTECYAHWSQACQARETAVANLLRYARMLRATAAEPKAA